MLNVGKSRKIKENLRFIQGKRWPGVGKYDVVMCIHVHTVVHVLQVKMHLSEVTAEVSVIGLSFACEFAVF